MEAEAVSANFPVVNGKVVIDGVARKTDGQKASVNFLIIEGIAVFDKETP